jgi:hypothetical protein
MANRSQSSSQRFFRPVLLSVSAPTQESFIVPFSKRGGDTDKQTLKPVHFFRSYPKQENKECFNEFIIVRNLS